MSAAERPMWGIHPGLTDQTVGVTELALAADERGVESFYLPEHTHMPLHYDRASYPPGGDLAERYKRLVDPYIGLSFAAARTSMEVGTAVSLVAQHDAVSLAKQIATLDMLSGGRFVLGVGFGWCLEEFETHHAVSGKERAEVGRETVELMRSIWADDVASYDGDYLKLRPSWSWPKPVQRSVPVLVGGVPAARTFKRVVEWGDGWLCVIIDVLSERFERAVKDLRQRWERAGRDPELLKITTLIGPLAMSDLKRAEEAAMRLGVQHLLIHLEDTAGTELFQILDDLGELIAASPRAA